MSRQEIITTLHPENDSNVDLYPNIKQENIPVGTIDYSRLSNDVKSLLNSINELHPSGVDTSSNILAFTEDKGIYIGSDTGDWYYWNGTQYVDGGEYIADPSYDELSDEIDDINVLLTGVTTGDVKIPLVQNSAWDNSTTIPTPVNATGYTRLKMLIPYNENNKFITSSSNYISIFYDEDKQYLGEERGTIYTSNTSAKYIAIFWAEVVSNEPTLILYELVRDVYKNAYTYGFTPDNDADTNAINLQACLNGGGTIIIDRPGIYDLGRTTYIDDNTTIIFGEGVYIKRAVNSDNKKARHLFVNRDAGEWHYNNNIKLYNLKVIPNGAFVDSENDVQLVYGLRGLVAFFCVNNLVIDGYEFIDLEYTDYALQVCNFNNIVLKNMIIKNAKDGIHLGRGEKFIIDNIQLLTNDDGIALNAVDYPYSNPSVGDIKDGVIQNVTLLSADGTTFERKRGMLLLNGSWMEWTSGRYYKKCGDYCKNNGIVYQTCGQIGVGSEYYVIGTEAPTHLSGIQQTADGLLWMYKGTVGDLNAKVKNVEFRNFYIYRDVENVALFSSEYSPYIRAVYTDTTFEPPSNITFDNISILGLSTCFLQFETQVDNIRVNNSTIKGLTEGFLKFRENETMTLATNVRMALVGNYYKFANDFSYFVGTASRPYLTLTICGSMCGDGFSFVQDTTNLNPTFRSNDLT